MYRSLRRLTVTALTGLLLTACSSAPGATSSPPGQSTGVVQSQPAASSAAPSPSAGPLTKATLRLDWFISPHQVPFIYAKHQGYYAAEGLDVTILEGRGSLLTSQIIAGGADTFGYVAGSTAATGIAGGMPIKMVADYLQIQPAMIIYLCDRETLNQPTDLKGKTLETTTGATPYVDLLPALLSKYGMSLDDIHVVSLDPKARVAALISGQIDLEAGFGYSTLGDIQQAAKAANAGEVCHLDFSDYGINALGHGIIVNQSTISNSPDVIEKFLRASNKGWQDALANPAAAVDATIADWPLTNHDFLTAGMQVLPDTLHTANTQGKPLGWMAEQDWADTLNILTEYAGFTGEADPSLYYTDDFVPAQ